ncbi:hypothetical protein RNI52_31895 [Labrys neptuniae]|uniref:hypothetical protein n=1 Tax=Labrys neptuniae TaxID=376174 RepID=UPI002890E795|nr:hypothetical protein [Labrys neptuniae]MDT3381972.1 hypothetical protein [Labrys neptuniae]
MKQFSYTLENSRSAELRADRFIQQPSFSFAQWNDDLDANLRTITLELGRQPYLLAPNRLQRTPAVSAVLDLQISKYPSNAGAN